MIKSFEYDLGRIELNLSYFRETYIIKENKHLDIGLVILVNTLTENSIQLSLPNNHFKGLTL